jgi:protein-S-isoprenylcysteine O-methyltransferase Ste14
MVLPGPDLLGIAFGCSELALSAVKRSRGRSRPAGDRTLRMLWVTILLSVAVAVMSATLLPQAGSRLLEFLYPLGLALFVTGLALRWWAIVHLGRFFTVDVAIADDHRVVATGPYRFVRHPSYTGAIVAFVGYGICLGNRVSLLALAVPVTLAFLQRIKVEETALHAALGDAYGDYAQRTRALLPFVY